MSVKKKVLNSFFLCLIYSLICCNNENKPVNKTVDKLFYNKDIEYVILDYSKTPRELEQYLIDQISLEHCDIFGTCDLPMAIPVNKTDTVYFPVIFQGLFKSENSAIFCGYRPELYILINQNDDVLFEEKPIDIDDLEDELCDNINMGIEEGRANRNLGLNIRWHKTSSYQIKEDVFSTLIRVATKYYSNKSSQIFGKKLEYLAEDEKMELLERVVPIYITMSFNNNVKRIPE